MDSSVLQGLLDFIAQHQLLAGLVVFITAFAESLAIVGLFMPGAVLMFSFGMLIGGGQLDFATTMAWAVLGAIAGDGLSFWLGHHYRQRLKVMWPFKRYPRLFAKGTDFFTKHGGKSILFGRFVGPVRPIIPVVAGMLEMPWLHFTLVNLVSALLWAPAYLLPGMAFGASLGLAAEVAGRLVVVLLLVIALLWLTVWLVRRVLHYLQPRTNPLIHHTLRLTRNIPYFGAATEALLDPEHPETRALTSLFLLLLVAMAAFAVSLQYTVWGDGPGSLNLTVHNLIQELRTDSIDSVMLWVTQFGSLYFLLPFTALALAALLAVRDYATSLYLVALLAFAELTVVLLKNLTMVARPTEVFHGLMQYAFPSNHAVMATVFFGFLAVVFAARMPGRWHWLPYSFAATVVSLVVFSRLYLGVHWLTDLVAGVAIGLALAALAGIAYRRHHRCHLKAGMLLGGSSLAFLLSIFYYTNFAPPAAYLASTQPVAIQRVSQAAWLQQDWRQLPAVRHDLRGFNDHPFNLQWAGSERALTDALGKTGWQATEPLRLGTALRYLLANRKASELPVPSHVHDTRNQDLLFTRPLSDGDRLGVIRLWPSQLQLTDGTPVWFGSITLMYQKQELWFLHLLRTEHDYVAPLQLLDDYLQNGNCTERRQPDGPLLLCH